MRVFAGVEVGSPIEFSAYRTNKCKPWILSVMKKAEDAIINHEYLPLLRKDGLTKAVSSLLLGEKAIKDKLAFEIQYLSGSGALRVGAEFLVFIFKRTTFCYFTPTWENHHKVFVYAGFTEPRTYRYWDQERPGINPRPGNFRKSLFCTLALTTLPASTGTVEGNCRHLLGEEAVSVFRFGPSEFC